jgi:hypothetical protein
LVFGAGIGNPYIFHRFSFPRDLAIRIIVAPLETIIINDEKSAGMRVAGKVMPCFLESLMSILA